MVVEYHKLEGSHSKYQSTQKLFDRDFLEKTSKIKELTISVAQLEKVIEQKNVEIGETLSILDHKQNECRHAQEQVRNITQLLLLLNKTGIKTAAGHVRE